MILARTLTTSAFLASIASLAGAQPPLMATDAWARQPAPSRDVTAVYVTLTSTSAEPARIISAESPLAKTLELHEMTMDGAMMRMRRIDEIVVPAKGRVALEPGGLHLMLFGLTRSLKAGERFPLTLKLSTGATIVLDVVVRGPESLR